MSLAMARCRGRNGIHAPLVTVEAHLSNGLPAFSIVGLPEAAVRESRERIRSAILNSGFEFPRRRMTVNLAPAELPKDGGRYDLAIALALLAASGQLQPEQLAGAEFFAELSLEGHLRGVSGVLPAAIAAGEAGCRLVVGPEDAAEASLPGRTRVHVATTLAEICNWLKQDQWPDALHSMPPRATDGHFPDMAQVMGQAQARRALEIAAAGRHNLLMCGPPGAGKSMLARRLPGLLPPLGREQALEVAALYSVSSRPRANGLWYLPPWRSPHHTSSTVALVGGGSNPRPGEISLAHHGVLFLDELPEFERRVLEVLREPMEAGEICISRAARQMAYPAQFQLVAAMNPCPCGFLGDPVRCHCSPAQVLRYRTRISGPLLDRIDLRISMPALPLGELVSGRAQAESSASIRARVAACDQRQRARQGCTNVLLDGEGIAAHCSLSAADRGYMLQALQRLEVSARAWHRLLRVARTIADLADSERIERPHLLEALSLRGDDP